MFISHVYATKKVSVGEEVLVNYGQNYCELLTHHICVIMTSQLISQFSRLATGGMLSSQSSLHQPLFRSYPEAEVVRRLSAYRGAGHRRR